MERKRRYDSCFGIHFDFHARKGTHPVGKHQRPDIFAEMLDTVKPDYLQCDTKGHQGLCSYPTKCGYQAPDITVDNLRMLRDLTAERGIALYAHYSGLYDITCAEEHPDWCVVNADGSVHHSAMSVFGPYPDAIVIPQMKEIAVDYGLDGCWLDGDCWWTVVDYSVHARRAWKKDHEGEPARPGEEGYDAYREFCRQGFRDYMRHVAEEIKAAAPDFQVCSNWMYSAQMPEKPTIPLDFISGDYAPQNSYLSARFHSRCMMNQGVSWDLMAWGQNAIEYSWMTDDRTTKELNQYCQEASVVLALGGGFEFFNHQYDGGCLVQQWAIPMWGKVAQFCRDREPYCFRAKEIPQVGVLFSQAAAYDNGRPNLNSSFESCDRVAALVDICADSQIPSGVILTHQALDWDLSGYGAILVPDSRMLEPEVIAKLKAYAENGGSLLLCGPDAARHFGVPVTETVRKLTYVAYDNRMASFTGNRADFIDPDPATVSGTCHDGNYFESPSYPMSLSLPTGKGKIEVLNFDLGTMYQKNRSTLIRDYFTSRIDLLFPDRKLKVSGSCFADVSLMQKDGVISVHLINSAGQHSDINVRGFNEIPKIGPLKVELKLDKAPTRVMLQPESTELPYTFENGVLTTELPVLEIYSIITVE